MKKLSKSAQDRYNRAISSQERLKRERLEKDALLAKTREVFEQIPEQDFPRSLVEKWAILQAVIKGNGNLTLTARLPQINKRGLCNKLKEYGLRK